MSKFSYYFFVLMMFFFLATQSGCSAIQSYHKSQEQKKFDIQLKKDRYMSLKRDIATNHLHNGVLAQELKSKYGSPDDVFYSSSSICSFQIWTYDISADKLKDTTLSPIILYLENDKLVSWKY